MPFDYAESDGLALAALIARREVSTLEVVEEAIRRIEALNPVLNAVVYKAYDEARERARGELKGPFAGVPMLLKDIGGEKKGWPTRQGAAFTSPTPSDHNSTIVQRYEAAGAIALGKTNVPEFGLLGITEPAFYGPARNPWDPARSPGGSSGGSAAAVAAGIVPIAHAGDGGGSIRIPASCCGLVGLKPTRARTPAGPDVGDWMGGLVIDHILCRTVRDSAAMLDATAGPAPGDPYHAPPQVGSYLAAMTRCRGKLRIAFAVDDLYGGRAHDPCVDAVLRTAKLLEEMGHVVEEASPQLSPEYGAVRDQFEAIWTSGHAMLIEDAAATRGRPVRRDDVQGMVWAVHQHGIHVTAMDYLRAWTALSKASRQVAAFHETYDIWLTPTMNQEPWPIGKVDLQNTKRREAFAPMRGYVPWTGLQNITGQPAISLPLHMSPGGMPIGVHFVGRFGAEDVLLGLAAALEEAAPWAGCRPPLHA